MTSAITARNYSVSAAQPAFYQQRFKLLLLYKDYVVKKCIAIFYYVLSTCFSLFNQWRADQYKARGYYYRHTADRQMSAYSHFKNELIDFSRNLPRLQEDRELPVPSSNQLDTLKKYYGKEVVERWARIGTEEIPVKIEELLREGLAKGCCFGMSLDFIAEYMRETRSGKSPLEAALSIAPRYREGAPDKAQLAQIFHHALDVKLLVDSLHRNTSSRIAEVERAGEERARAGKPDLTKEELSSQLNEFFSYIKNQVLKIHIKASQQIADQFHLKMESAALMYARPELEREKETAMLLDLSILDRATTQLPASAYSIDLSPFDSNGGHRIVWIKTSSGPHLIFDANHGTLCVEPSQAAAKILQIARLNYPNNGFGNINFIRFT